jgi:AcrR family transcriptional regulator
MGIKDRREREKLDRRNAILSAAQDIFREKGYEATMDEIAEKVELSKPTLYLYFKNKDDLYASIALDGFKTLKEAFRQVVESGLGVEDKVRALYRSFITFTMEHKQVSGITEFVLSEAGRKSVSEELSEKMNQDISDLLGYAARVVQEGMQEGVFDDGEDPLVVSIIVWRSIVGLISLAIEDGLANQDPGFYERLFESALAILTEGIRQK